MLVSPAFAQAGGAPGGFEFSALIPLILIFVVFWFLLIQPQRKKMKQHKEMLSRLRRGDRVVTGGGIIGRITRVESDDNLIVEIARGVSVKIARSTIAELLAQSGPAGKSEGESGAKTKKGK